MTYKTPGVYVEEISKLPPSVAQVETAIPAFIGYTKNSNYKGITLAAKPKRIKSLADFVEIFGAASPAMIHTGSDDGIKIKKENGEFKLNSALADPFLSLNYRMYYSLQLYFGNGGGPCYIVSCGAYKDDKNSAFSDDEMTTAMTNAVKALKKEDEPTMILFTDAVSISEPAKYYGLCTSALSQCADLMDRVVIIDLLHLDPTAVVEQKATDVAFLDLGKDLTGFRNRIGINSLSYGAAYYPWLRTSLDYFIDESAIKILPLGTDIPADTVLRKNPAEGKTTPTDDDAKKSLYHAQSSIYAMIKKEISKFQVISPPSPAIAGVYAMVDSTRGVWKAPANVSLNYVKEPAFKIDDEDQRDMNVTATGKSVNAIRTFTGKGVLVWGARTLAGNDNEWRYISVRRFYNMVEESVKKATEPFVFEPNDANTWVKVRAMIENFLILQWRQGALMGAKPEEAFFVHVGLGETMTALDILEGRMIIEIGMAVVRPAEFIILRFSHKMVVS